MRKQCLRLRIADINIVLIFLVVTKHPPSNSAVGLRILTQLFRHLHGLGANVAVVLWLERKLVFRRD